MAHSTNSITTADETSTDSPYGLFDGSEQTLGTPCHTIALGELMFGSLIPTSNPYLDAPGCSSLWQPFVDYMAVQASSPDWTFTANHPDDLTNVIQPGFEYLLSSLGGQFDLPYESISLGADNNTALASYCVSNDLSNKPIWSDQSCLGDAFLAYNVDFTQHTGSIPWPGSELIMPMTRSTTASSIRSSASTRSSASSDSHPNLATSVLSSTDPAHDQSHMCNHRNCTRLFKTAKQLSQHKRCHSKRYRCKDEGCRKHDVGFGTRRDLERHERAVHAGERKECPHCRKKIKRYDNLRRHIATMHKDAEPNRTRLQPCIQQTHIDDNIAN